MDKREGEDADHPATTTGEGEKVEAEGATTSTSRKRRVKNTPKGRPDRRRTTRSTKDTDEH